MPARQTNEPSLSTVVVVVVVVFVVLVAIKLASISNEVVHHGSGRAFNVHHPRDDGTRMTLAWRMRGQDLSKRRHEPTGLAKGCDVSAYYTFKACICTVAWVESCIRRHPTSPTSARRFSTSLAAWSLFLSLSPLPSIPPFVRGVRAFRYIPHTTAIAEDPTKRSTTAAALTEIPLFLDIFISRFVGVHPTATLPPLFFSCVSFAQLVSRRFPREKNVHRKSLVSRD